VNAARYSLVADIRISSSDSEKSIAQSVATPSSPPDLSASLAINDKTIASGAKPRSVSLIIISVG
jgi:hypothetical protein